MSANEANAGQGYNHVNFGLDAQGESLLVYNVVNHTNFTLIDSLGFGAQTNGVSSGRLRDGQPNILPFPGTESPGYSNYRLLTNVFINEALAHTDLPLEDAIELRNPTASPVSINGWYLSNDRDNLRKHLITNAAPTPGANNNHSSPDTDGDGIPDWAEDRMGLDRNNPLDAGYDPDGDGMTNLQEYLAGTNHLDTNSRLRLDGIAVAGNVTLSFQAVAGRTYSVLQTASLTSPSWTKFADVPAQSVTQWVNVVGPQASAVAQFYRLVTPALP